MSRIEDFETALDRFDDVLRQPDTEYIRDAAIQRFEFCFELAWKTTQEKARQFGSDTASARTAIGFAWRSQWIEDEGAWLELLKARNLTVHTYHEETAAAIYEQLPYFASMFRALLNTLKSTDTAPC